MASNFDDFKLAVEALSGGKNTVILDDVGMPSVMVQIPKYKMSQLISGGSENVHPAFMIDGAEKDVMYVGKFHDVVINDRTYSLPIKDPAAWVTFDQGVTYNRNKGKGWSLMPYALWCAIALWCHKNNCMPHGNNNYGSDANYPTESGIESLADNGKTAHVYEGSGPASWYHDGTRAGIYGMNGNVWDRVAGMRLYDGEIQVIPYSNCFLSDASMAAGSSLWKAIDVSGNLVAPGSSNTLKYVTSTNKLTAGSITPTDAWYSASFTDMALDSSITSVPEIAKALLLYPDEPKGDYGGDYHAWNTSGERIPCCGGNWTGGSAAGVFYVFAVSARSSSSSSFGLRSAYCAL